MKTKICICYRLKTINVYKIINPKDPGVCYVGSTQKTLKQRMSQHRCMAKHYPNRKIYKDCGDIRECEIVLLETRDIPMYNFQFRRKEIEQEWIDKLTPRLNTYRANTTREQTLDQMKARLHRYRSDPDYIAKENAYRREWRKKKASKLTN